MEGGGHAIVVGARHQRQHAEIGQRLHGPPHGAELGQVFDLDARAILAHQHEIEFADQTPQVQQLVQRAAQGGAVEADVGDTRVMREPVRHVEIENGPVLRQLLGVGRHAAVPLGVDAAARFRELRRRDARMAEKVGGIVAISLHGARTLLRNAVRNRARVGFVQGCLLLVVVIFHKY